MSVWNEAATIPATTGGRVDGIVARTEARGSWKWRNGTALGLYTRFDRIGFAFTVLSSLSSILGVLEHYGWEYNTTSIILTVISFILFDITRIARLFLSFVVRIMISVNLSLALSCIWIANEDYYMLVSVVAIVSTLAAVVSNKTLLRSENWKYSEAVQYAMTMDEDNEADRAWTSWGMRECRSLYGNIGYDPDNEVIDAYAKPVFFYTWYSMKDKYVAREERYNSEWVERMNLQQENEELKIKIADFEQNELERRQAAAEEDDMYIFNQLRERLNEAEKRISEMEGRDQELTVRNEQLLAVNEELMKDLEESESKKDDRYLFMNQDDRINELLRLYDEGDKRLSYQKIADLVGVKSKTTIEKRYQKYKEQK